MCDSLPLPSNSPSTPHDYALARPARSAWRTSSTRRDWPSRPLVRYGVLTGVPAAPFVLRSRLLSRAHQRLWRCSQCGRWRRRREQRRRRSALAALALRARAYAAVLRPHRGRSHCQSQHARAEARFRDEPLQGPRAGCIPHEGFLDRCGAEFVAFDRASTVAERRRHGGANV